MDRAIKGCPNLEELHIGIKNRGLRHTFPNPDGLLFVSNI